MKHIVRRTVRDLRDVDDFLRQTHKFSKKFYTVDLVGGERLPYQLNVRAIAVSRDLIYKLRWMMKAKSWNLDPEAAKKGPIPEYDPVKVRDHDAPTLYWIPLEENALKKLYPNTADVPDEPGECHWMDIFASWDFKQVDFIEETE